MKKGVFLMNAGEFILRLFFGAMLVALVALLVTDGKILTWLFGIHVK